MIDLHMHSTASDGSDEPTELVAIADKLNLRTIALTDHDCVDGLPAFFAAGRHAKVDTLGGLEISLEYNKASLHMLGYLFDLEHPGLCEALRQIRGGRSDRNVKILAKLRECGVAISMDEVEAEAGGDVVGRPHFAQVLLRKGAVMSTQEAFDVYLASGAKAYVNRFRLSLKAGVTLIREAGGVPVLAHPYLIKTADEGELRALIAELADYGLLGLEVWYTKHSPINVELYSALAKEFGLIETGGSDYHGTMHHDVQMGFGHGDLRVPNEAADRVIAAAETELAKCSSLGSDHAD